MQNKFISNYIVSQRTDVLSSINVLSEMFLAAFPSLTRSRALPNKLDSSLVSICRRSDSLITANELDFMAAVTNIHKKDHHKIQ